MSAWQAALWAAIYLVWLGLLWQSLRNLAKAVRLLHEVHRCNAEFAEAVALLRCGAHEEAIEVASRWQKRRAPAGSRGAGKGEPAR